MTEAATRPPVPSPDEFDRAQKARGLSLLQQGMAPQQIRDSLVAEAAKCGMPMDAAMVERWMPFAGATSWDEYDDYEEIQAKQRAVYDLQYAFSSMLDTVLHGEEPLSEKLTAVIDLAEGLRERLGETADEDMGEGEKAEFSAGQRRNLAKRGAAMRGGGFPIRNEADLKNAIQAIGRAKNPDAAKAHIRKRARALGLTKLLPESWSSSKEADDRSFIDRIFGRKKEAVPEMAGVFRSYKDARGDLRWLAVYSNCFKDVDGETFSYEAHKAYVDYVDATKDYPELWLFHVPGTKSGKADLIDLTSDGFMLASGTYDEGKKELAEKLAAGGPWQVSHGYDYVKHRGLVNGVYQPGYKTFEISPLPLGRAANPLTGFAPNQEEVMTLTPWKKDALKDLGIDIEGIEKGLSTAAQKAKEAGHEITFKELAEALTENPAEAAAATKDQEQAATTTAATGGIQIDWTAEGVAVQIKEAMGAAMAPLAATLAEVKDAQQKQAEAIAQLQKSDDEKIAAALAPRARPGGGFVASEAKESQLDGRTAAAKAAAEGIAGVPEHLAPYADIVPGLKEMYAGAAEGR